MTGLEKNRHRTDSFSRCAVIPFRHMERDSAAILRYFQEHHEPLFRFAWRLTGSVADAEDIVQECFLALLRPGCAFDPNRTSLRTYLFGAVHNQALKRFHHSEITAQTPDPPTPERECYVAEMRQVVLRAILQLPGGATRGARARPL